MLHSNTCHTCCNHFCAATGSTLRRALLSSVSSSSSSFTYSFDSLPPLDSVVPTERLLQNGDFEDTVQVEKFWHYAGNKNWKTWKNTSWQKKSWRLLSWNLQDWVSRASLSNIMQNWSVSVEQKAMFAWKKFWKCHVLGHVGDTVITVHALAHWFFWCHLSLLFDLTNVYSILVSKEFENIEKHAWQRCHNRLNDDWLSWKRV